MPIPATSTVSLTERFREMFGSSAHVPRARRVNLIGEHTDYNDGFGDACGHRYYTVGGSRQTQRRDCRGFISERFQEKVTLSLNKLSGPPHVTGVTLSAPRCNSAGARTQVVGR